MRYFLLFSFFASAVWADEVQLFAQVRSFKVAAGVRYRMEIIEGRDDATGTVFKRRLPTVAEFEALIQDDPKVKDLVSEVFETDAAAYLAGKKDKSETVEVVFGEEKLEELEEAMNSFFTRGLYGMRKQDEQNIDRKLLKELLAAKDKSLQGKSAESKDIQSLYDALALLLADKRCDLRSVYVVGMGKSKGISPKISLDTDLTDISFGKVSFRRKGVADEVELSWDAEHLTNMTVKDWLYGHPQGASNGHVGFYKQLAQKKLCGLDAGVELHAAPLTGH